MKSNRWSVRLTAAAEADFRQVVQWTAENFGPRQARTYAKTLTAALEALTDGPTALGVQRRDDIGKGLHSLHVARAGRKGRHFVMFRVAPDTDRTVDVLRLLHDAMDLPRHVAANDEGP